MYQNRKWLTIAFALGFASLIFADINGCSQTCRRCRAVVVSPKTAPAAQRDTYKRKRVARQEQSVDDRSVEQLAATIEERTVQALGNAINIEKGWKEIDVIGFSGRPGAKTLELNFTTPTSDTPFAVYYLVAWQPLFSSSDDSPVIKIIPPLLTVTERALVFGSSASVTSDDDAPSLTLQRSVAEAVQLEKNQHEITNEVTWALPEKLRVISLQVYPHYAVVQAALPGSGTVQPSELSKTFPARMVRLSLVPDRGRVIRQWIAPEKSGPPSSGTCPCERNSNTKDKTRSPNPPSNVPGRK